MSVETLSKTPPVEKVKKVVEVEPEVPAAPTTVTNWKVLTQGGFIPVRVKCDGYKGNHPAELSCHTVFAPTTVNILRHMASDHGLGTFKIKFRLSDKGTSPIWAELAAAGVEIQEFYCPHCREQVPMSPRRIIYHLQGHPGANRINLDPQTLCLTLSTQRPDSDESDGLYMDRLETDN